MWFWPATVVRSSGAVGVTLLFTDAFVASESFACSVIVRGSGAVPVRSCGMDVSVFLFVARGVGGAYL